MSKILQANNVTQRELFLEAGEKIEMQLGGTGMLGV